MLIDKPWKVQKSVLKHIIFPRNGPKSHRFFDIVQIWPGLLNSEGSYGHFLEIWYVRGHFFGLFKAYLLISRNMFVFKHNFITRKWPKKQSDFEYGAVLTHSARFQLLVEPFFGNIMCPKTLLGAFKRW